MVADGTGRREFIRNAASLGGVGFAPLDTGADSGPLDAPAFGLPDLDADHSVRWSATFDADSAVFPVARTRGRVFTVVRTYTGDEESEDGPYSEVVALDATSGAVEWRHTVDGEMSIPQTGDGLVFVAGPTRLLAFDAASGERRWTVQRETIAPHGFVVDDGTVFVAGGARTAAIDADTGQFRWTTDRRTYRFRQALPGDGQVYVGSSRGFHALDRDDGSEEWVVEVPTDAATWPAGVRDGLLVGWSDGVLYGIRTRDGARRWQTDLPGVGPYDSLGVVGSDTVYVWGDELTALDVETGEIRWTHDGDRQGYSVRASNGLLLFVTDDGSFVAVEADSGREAWRFEVGRNRGYWGSVADGRAYVVGESALHVFDVDSGLETWRLDLDGEPLWADVVGDLAFAGTIEGTLYAVDRPSPLATAPVATLRRTATSPTGLGVLGLLGVGLLGVGYRKLAAENGADDPAVEFGRLARLGGGPATEIDLKRVRTPAGSRLVAETRLTDDRHREAFVEAVEQWADLAASVEGVLPVVASGADPTPWSRTPYVESGSLADAWPLARRARVEVVSGVARTLHAAHREGVAHGSLAPRHVFPGSPGGGRDSDSPGGDRRLRARDVRVGGWFVEDGLPACEDESDPYAPPERAAAPDAGVGGGGVREDVYRVAALAHHLLAGEVPTPVGDSGASSASESGASADAPDSPAGEFSDDLADVLGRALAADPETRYDSLLAFDDAFRWAALTRRARASGQTRP